MGRLFYAPLPFKTNHLDFGLDFLGSKILVVRSFYYRDNEYLAYSLHNLLVRNKVLQVFGIYFFIKYIEPIQWQFDKVFKGKVVLKNFQTFWKSSRKVSRLESYCN